MTTISELAVTIDKTTSEVSDLREKLGDAERRLNRARSEIATALCLPTAKRARRAKSYADPNYQTVASRVLSALRSSPTPMRLKQLAEQIGGNEAAICVEASKLVAQGKVVRVERGLYVMSPVELEEQRRSFAYGNTSIENEHVTREVVDKAAEDLRVT